VLHGVRGTLAAGPGTNKMPGRGRSTPKRVRGAATAAPRRVTPHARYRIQIIR